MANYKVLNKGVFTLYPSLHIGDSVKSEESNCTCCDFDSCCKGFIDGTFLCINSCLLHGVVEEINSNNIPDLIPIKFDGTEYRVPGKDRKETSAFYTTVFDDAINVFRDTFGILTGYEIINANEEFCHV